MATVIIRNLEPGVVERLKLRASRSGRSLEEELRQLLRRAAGADRDAFLDWVAERRLAVPSGIDIVQELRRDRDTR